MADGLPGESLIRALIEQDHAGARALLAPAVQFRALLPGRLVEAAGAERALAILAPWFPPGSAIERLESDLMIDRPRVLYRVRWPDGDDRWIFEQQAYYDVVDGKIVRFHALCSGDRPAP
jgi:hypothetical protein